MTGDTALARSLLSSGGLTLALCRRGMPVTSTMRGVAPLLELLDAGGDWTGACAADRVVGAGAAWLYVLLGVAEVWTPVMSRPARRILRAHGVSVVAERVTAGISNRAGTGPCPVEAAVAGIDDPEEALDAIRRTLARLSAGTPLPKEPVTT